MCSEVRGRSQLSTFMKAYTAYARGEGSGTTVRFPPENQHLFLITDNIIKYCTCLECGQYAHICRSFMYNNTFEARFLTSTKLPKGAFFGRKQWRHTAVSVRPHRGATEFSPLELILVHKIAPNCEYFTNHLMQYVLQYFYNKK